MLQNVTQRLGAWWALLNWLQSHWISWLRGLLGGGARWIPLLGFGRKSACVGVNMLLCSVHRWRHRSTFTTGMWLCCLCASAVCEAVVDLMTCTSFCIQSVYWLQPHYSVCVQYSSSIGAPDTGPTARRRIKVTFPRPFLDWDEGLQGAAGTVCYLRLG